MSGERLVCDPPALDWSQAAGPRTTEYDDVYFSAEDGLEETRAVFLQGCGLPQAWAGRTCFTVGELGFGTGLNALALWQMWRAHKAEGAWLDFVSIEKQPLSRDQAARALAAWPELAPLAGRLLAQWPSRLKGAHRMVFSGEGFAITVHHGEAEAALGDIPGPVDAWFLDGFAPARNEAMWSPAVLDAVGRLSAPGARAATFTVAGAVRRGLQAAGFAVDKRPGFGRKRERLEAVFAGAGRERPEPVSGPVAIVGAGIAGASLARALRLRSVETVLVDAAGLAGGASGAPAGLLTPRLERADRPHVRATLAAFAFARRLYDGMDGFHAGGVVRLPKDEAEAARLAAIAAMMGEGYDWTGEALLMEAAGHFEPARLVAALAGETGLIEARIARVEQGGGAMRLYDETGTVVCEAEAVVHASGASAAAVLADLSPSAGQAAVFNGEPPARPVSWGGYAGPAPGGVLVGATHCRGEDPGDTESAIAGFRAGVAERLPELALGEVVACWSGVRAATPDRLPVLGRVGPREFILGGMGSRGFAHAPLLAETLAAEMCGHAAALEISGRAALDCGRFAARRRRRAG